MSLAHSKRLLRLFSLAHSKKECACQRGRHTLWSPSVPKPSVLFGKRQAQEHTLKPSVFLTKSVLLCLPLAKESSCQEPKSLFGKRQAQEHTLCQKVSLIDKECALQKGVCLPRSVPLWHTGRLPKSVLFGTLHRDWRSVVMCRLPLECTHQLDKCCSVEKCCHV